jgi:hypothetical protein
MCVEDRNLDESRVTIKTGDENTPFRVLGVFRTLRDRSQMHMQMVEGKVIGVCYNLKRIPCSEEFAITVVSSMINTHFVFPAGLVSFTKTFVTEMETLVITTLKNKFGAKLRFPFQNLMVSFQLYGRRSLQECIDAAIIRMTMRELNSNQWAREVVAINMSSTLHSKVNNGVSIWKATEQAWTHTRDQYIGDMRDALMRAGLCISFLDSDLDVSVNQLTIRRWGKHHEIVQSHQHQQGIIVANGDYYDRIRKASGGEMPLTTKVLSASSQRTLFGKRKEGIITGAEALTKKIIGNKKGAIAFDVWIDTWTIRDQGGNRIITPSLEPNHWEEKILNRMALI